MCGDEVKYSETAFTQCTAEYSMESMKEIKEELNALYSPKDIDSIIMCLTGFKKQFSVKELKERIELYFNNTLLNSDFVQILQDIYRVGIIGNKSKSTDIYRWQHKGDEGLILDDEWNIIIHRALWKNLSINGNFNNSTFPANISK